MGWIERVGASIAAGSTLEIPDVYQHNEELLSDEDLEIVSIDVPGDGISLETEITVGIDKDFETLSDAISYLENKYFVNGLVIKIDPGLYSGTHTINLFQGKSLTVECSEPGELDGFGYPQGSNLNGFFKTANSGEGVIGLANAGNDITVTCATTNPDFSAAGIVPGNKIAVLDASGTIHVLELTGVAGNVLTFGVAAPNVAGVDSAIGICPKVELDDDIKFFNIKNLTVSGIFTYSLNNRVFDFNTINKLSCEKCGSVRFIFAIDSIKSESKLSQSFSFAAGINGAFSVTTSYYFMFFNCVGYGFTAFACRENILVVLAFCTAISSGNSGVFFDFCKGNVTYCSIRAGSYGVYAERAYLSGANSVIERATIGVVLEAGSVMDNLWIVNTVKNCPTGYYINKSIAALNAGNIIDTSTLVGVKAENASIVEDYFASTVFISTPTPFSPAVKGVQGNNNSMIV